MPRTGTEEEVGLRLGQVVRRWRKEFDWRQEDLAEKSGLPQTYISKFELGQSGDPGISRIIAICLAFRRSPCDLLKAANLLAGPRPSVEMLENMATVVGMLSEERQQAALEYLHVLQGMQERENKERSSSANGHEPL
jgi:transcriptional regulator with XRE-family HTH domain